MILESPSQPSYSKVSVFFTALGAILIFLGIALHVQREIEKQGMQETNGTLIELFQKERGKGFHNPGICPRVRFYTLNQVPVTVEGRQCSSSSVLKVGDSVSVFYPPEHPEQALLVVTVDEWFYVMLSCSSGAMMWLFAFCTRSRIGRVGLDDTFMHKWCIPLSFGFITLIIYGLSFLVLQDRQAKQARMTEITIGTVINPGHANTGRNSTSSCALIEFQTPDHKTYEFTTSVCSNGYDHDEQVFVRYDPANPRHAMLDSFWDSMFLPILLFLLGTPFLMGVIFFPVFRLDLPPSKPDTPPR